MIEIRVIDNLFCPFLVCDYCNEPIEKTGNYYYAVSKTTWEPTGAAWMTHKSPCSKLDDVLEAADPSITIYSEELSVLLHRLIHNSKIKPRPSFMEEYVG